ncbi:MAG TPA: Gmad2 immunoglobulin-like domain-containing protein [Candidatus Paceibacterota bacterium]
MTTAKILTVVVLVLLAGSIAVIGFMYMRSSFRPSPAPGAIATSTEQEKKDFTNEAEKSPAPLSSRVVVTSPQAKQHVEQTFTVAGVAPGPWFFEAQFPMQVRDMEGNVVGRATATAQGEWMTEKQVTFTAMMQIDATFHGEAILILMKDNPSGMPEHDDAIELSITVD